MCRISQKGWHIRHYIVSKECIHGCFFLEKEHPLLLKLTTSPIALMSRYNDRIVVMMIILGVRHFQIYSTYFKADPRFRLF